MYSLFTRWGISPAAYHEKSAGEKVILRAFAEHYFEKKG